MELVGTFRLSEEYIGLGVVLEDYEKSLNSFGTGEFFPEQALKKLSSYIGPMSFTLKFPDILRGAE